MSQHDGDIINQNFAPFRSDLNNAIKAILSNSSGSTQPATRYAYQWWYDTATNTLKMRNAANDAWITIGTFNQTADLFYPLPGLTSTVAELNYCDGVSSNIQTQLNGKQSLNSHLTALTTLAKTNNNFVVTNGTTFASETPSAARSSLGLKSLALQDTIDSSDIAANAVDGPALDTSNGNGSFGQFLRSDGDGTFTWDAPTFVVGDNSISATQLYVSGNGNTSQYLRSDGDGTMSWVQPAASGVTFSPTGSISSTNVQAAIAELGTEKQAADADLTTLAGLAKTNGNFIVGNGSAWVAESGATARNSLGLGSLATLSAVGSSQITDNSVRAAELAVSGNGSNGQLLKSDGDGTFSWVNAPDSTFIPAAGAIGSYTLGWVQNDATARSAGYTVAGSSLKLPYQNTITGQEAYPTSDSQIYASVAVISSGMSGTWRLMHKAKFYYNYYDESNYTSVALGLWLRIS